MEQKSLQRVFAGKSVLITGNTGFKGSWLSFWLASLGANVVGYALKPNTTPSLYSALNLSQSITQYFDDVRDDKKLKEVIATHEPEFVFHLAAQSLVRKSYADPQETFHTNLIGSVNVLDAVKANDCVRSLVYITSDKCYENKEWMWGYRENDELGGKDPYSASKACAEIAFRSYYESFLKEKTNLGVASTRAGNVIGGGDWSADRIVPDCMRALEKNQTITIRSPHATRPWQHVLEPLSGYLSLAISLYKDSKKYSGSWNFGPNDVNVKTVQALCDTTIKYWGSGKVVVTDNTGPHECNLLKLNCDKAHQVLDWHPRWDFDETMKQVVGWYQGFSSGISAESLCQKQIDLYLNTITHESPEACMS